MHQDDRNGRWDVYQYDLANGSEKRLTTGASDQTQPSIDRHPWDGRPGNVVYVDDRRGAGDIYLRDGATGIVKPVCTAPRPHRASMRSTSSGPTGARSNATSTRARSPTRR